MDLESLTFLAGGVVSLFYGFYSLCLICTRDCSGVKDFTVWSALWGSIAALTLGYVLISSLSLVWGTQEGWLGFLLGSHEHGLAQPLRQFLSMGLFAAIAGWVYTQVVTPLKSKGCSDRPDASPFVTGLLKGLQKVEPFVLAIGGLYALGFGVVLIRYLGGSSEHGGAAHQREWHGGAAHQQGRPGGPAHQGSRDEFLEYLKEHNQQLLERLHQGTPHPAPQSAQHPQSHSAPHPESRPASRPASQPNARI
jgi:hypothetical protein